MDPVEPSARGTLRFWLETGPMMRSAPRLVEAHAWHLGMNVEVRTVGGWLSKTHYFRVAGPAEAINKLCVFVDELTGETTMASTMVPLKR